MNVRLTTYQYLFVDLPYGLKRSQGSSMGLVPLIHSPSHEYETTATRFATLNINTPSHVRFTKKKMRSLKKLVEFTMMSSRRSRNILTRWLHWSFSSRWWLWLWWWWRWSLWFHLIDFLRLNFKLHVDAANTVKKKRTCCNRIKMKVETRIY